MGAFDSDTGSRIAGALAAVGASGTDLSNPNLPNAPVEFYLIDSSHGFFIEEGQVNVFLGYFAARAPVCPSCQ
jgi:hypothetical protein